MTKPKPYTRTQASDMVIRNRIFLAGESLRRMNSLKAWLVKMGTRPSGA